MKKRMQRSNSVHTLFPKVQGYSGKKKILSLSLSRVRPNKYGVIFLLDHRKTHVDGVQDILTSGLQVLLGFHSEPTTNGFHLLPSSTRFPFFYHVGGTQIGTQLDPDQDHSSIRTSQQIR